MEFTLESVEYNQPLSNILLKILYVYMYIPRYITDIYFDYFSFVFKIFK